MIKKKARRKTAAAKKTAKRKSAPGPKKQMNPAEVRKDIAKMVGSGARKMAQAVIEEGKKGQLATVKYLFEVAEIFPPATEGNQGTPEEDSLAKTLLHRLNLPEEPVMREEDDEPMNIAILGKRTAKDEGGEDEPGRDESGDSDQGNSAKVETGGEKSEDRALV